MYKCRYETNHWRIIMKEFIEKQQSMETIWIHHLLRQHMHERPLEKRFLELYIFPNTCPSEELEELQQKKKGTRYTMEVFNFEVLIFFKRFSI
ncbi:uncharacterized protein CELE_T01H10.11 [Caenorhabditis elegans]|uniref:Uncharacterized protein n=1 Tax=Caenorhabditis elegans TaxID=6239 RepID=A0A164D3M4_CAEEL|nr:Uncharacterized protein CELE_T01H10.11 [Caenorhabditis elegans]SAP35626.1 Uncharacterized protein CELE_T01H10.11 [Caenorhabditis elegans]|eukprot:NP_001317858.1 Uncharacterized protein CELE_T01H10.11 [Caenorhabditis elegans]